MFKKISHWITQKADNLIFSSDKSVEKKIDYLSDRVVELDEINMLVKAKHGWFLANRFDYYIGAALIVYGEYSEMELAFLKSIVPKNGVIIEVGANIGSLTVGLAQHVGELGKVLAVEPQPSIFNVLCANLALNKIVNVDVRQCGCGEYTSKMYLQADNYFNKNIHNSGSKTLIADAQGLEISVFPIDSFANSFDFLSLIKIDVEGMELDVLKGAANAIKKHKPYLYIENAVIDKSKSIIEWIMSAGYDLWWHIPPLFHPQNFFSHQENLYGFNVSVNMICAPSGIHIPEFEKLTKITDVNDHILNRMNAFSIAERDSFFKDLFEQYRINT